MEEKQGYVSIDNKLCGKCVGCLMLNAVARTETLRRNDGADRNFVILDCENRELCEYLEDMFY